jgi:TPR repeat protein
MGPRLHFGPILLSSNSMMPATRPTLLLFLLMLSVPLRASGQEQQQEKQTQQQPKSPVFKSYRPPPAPRVLEETDLIYETWQAFITERKAVAGDPVAQHEIGIRYLLGRGVDPDTAKGAYWTARAAAQNVLPARYNLGILTYHGWGVEWNPFESFRQFAYCAEHDMVEAQYTLGEFYTQNLVVSLDWEKAVFWVGKAAQAGFTPAKKALEEIKKRMPQPEASRGSATKTVNADSTLRRQQDSSLASLPIFLDAGDDSVSRGEELRVLRNALRGADPEVQEALGISRIIDENMDLDSLGLDYIRNAAEGGSPEALAVLGRCYERGIQVRPDPVTAAFFYIRAIRMDAPKAGVLLWSLLQKRESVPALKSEAHAGNDTARYCWAALRGLGFDGVLMQHDAFLTDHQAVQFLDSAAGHGHLQAMIELGLCYYGGRWVAQNQPRAFSLWQQAAAMGSREAEVRLAAVTIQSGGSEENLERCVELLRRAVRDGSLLAETALGYCYETGRGVAVSATEAARLYRSGARRGSQDAYRALRRMHDTIRPAEEQFRIEE